LDRNGPGGEGRIDVFELLLRQGEQNRDRPDLGYDDNARVRSAPQVAFIDHADTGAAVDRRHDAGIVEDGFGIGDGGIVSLELSRELTDERALGIDRLWRHRK